MTPVQIAFLYGCDYSVAEAMAVEIVNIQQRHCRVGKVTPKPNEKWYGWA